MKERKNVQEKKNIVLYFILATFVLFQLETIFVFIFALSCLVLVLCAQHFESYYNYLVVYPFSSLMPFLYLIRYTCFSIISKQHSTFSACLGQNYETNVSNIKASVCPALLLPFHTKRIDYYQPFALRNKQENMHQLFSRCFLKYLFVTVMNSQSVFTSPPVFTMCIIIFPTSRVKGI